MPPPLGTGTRPTHDARLAPAAARRRGDPRPRVRGAPPVPSEPSAALSAPRHTALSSIERSAGTQLSNTVISVFESRRYFISVRGARRTTPPKTHQHSRRILVPLLRTYLHIQSCTPYSWAFVYSLGNGLKRVSGGYLGDGLHLTLSFHGHKFTSGHDLRTGSWPAVLVEQLLSLVRKLFYRL